MNKLYKPLIYPLSVEYNEKDHLKDYINIQERLLEEIKNHKQEYGGVTKQQLEYRLLGWFSDSRIDRIKNQKIKDKTDGVQ